ncbi:MAG: 30S ribosomal protein S6 [Candidatus Electrothrix aestuarii]|uniref:Small ribosomal subunit protein bS6 n=1 Tax=Candidatus Electrothrix aestuarii TaxID=3062594 RepID=A0AAU8M1H6_9BACT|nr:30S ribosomal protein S6 [Candidatus Electrothrix aestuarii]WPD24191.1 MAG: 30S ribosomal protein S6 [Candidatus Electrothrix sp. GW3-3]
MRHYETTYILRPNLGEEQFTEIIERTNAIVQDDGGSVIDIDRWGMKKLAYEIKKEAQGYYIYMNYAAPGSTIQEIERIFRIDDRVLRYLTVKLAEEIDSEGIDQEKERIAAVAAAKVAEAERLAQQNDEADDDEDGDVNENEDSDNSDDDSDDE